MTTAGPPVATLVHRLAATPSDFLAPPRAGGRGTVSVAAVAGDVLRSAGATLPEAWIARLAPPRVGGDDEANWLRGCLVTCWLVTDPVSMAGHLGAERFLDFLDGDLRRVTGMVRADALVHDPDRREELARLWLRAIGLVPAGESPEAAADRLATVDSVNRSRVEGEARRAEERSRELREALARRRAQQAASRASRE